MDYRMETLWKSTLTSTESPLNEVFLNQGFIDF